MHTSLGSLLRFALQGRHPVLDHIELPMSMENLIQDYYGKMLEKMFSEAAITFFASNLLTHCVELLFISSLHYSNQSQFNQE